MQRGFSRLGASLLLAACLSAATLEDSDRYYSAIRNNDLAALGALVKRAGVNIKDKRGTTPLMYSAAIGSAESMGLLIGAGADVNAKNAFDATALMWCATDFDKVRMLVEKGADVNARSKAGRTPLLIAAASDGSYPVVKYLVDKGADVSATDPKMTTPFTTAVMANDTETARFLASKRPPVVKGPEGAMALMSAAANGNVELVRMLLAMGVDVNSVSPSQTEAKVKNGPIALGNFTALILAAAVGGPEAVKVLLDAGANVNAQDIRGMTPLMLAVSTDRPSVAVVKMLAAKGDVSIRSKNGETAIDWAKKYQNPPVMEALGIERGAMRAAAVPVADTKPVALRAGVEKSVALLQRTSGSFMENGGCYSCHSQNLAALAVSAAQAQGYKVDNAAAADLAKGVRAFWSGFEQPLLQRLDPPAGTDLLYYSLLQMSASGVEPDRLTDAMVHNIASQQRRNGNWHVGGIARAPMEDGDFSRTALNIRALRLYGPEGRRVEFSDRIGRAAAWLERAAPRTTEDRTMQLLGLIWAKTGPVEDRVLELIANQRADGGWAQTPELASDAYATGQVLYALHEAGVPSTDAAYRRGTEFLLRTEMADGSWHVVSRAPKFQPYFQSGFPHDHDQWISTAGTGWATLGLAYAVPEAGEVARVQ